MEQKIPEDEDEQLKLAIAMSLQEVANANSTVHAPEKEHPSSLLGLDRKAMEIERLERIKARASSPSSSKGSLKRTAQSMGLVQLSDCTDAETSTGESSKLKKRPRLQGQTNSTRLRFPRGSIMKTWCYGFDRTENDIKIEEVLDKDHLKLAILSSFQWDMEWVFSKLNPSTKLVLVMQAKEEATREQYRRETAGNQNLRLCFPPMPGNVNCMHSKLMLLSFPGHLRIVIPTANLVPFDWGETGVMENSLFVIDLPRWENGVKPEQVQLSPFVDDLIYFCNAMGLNDDIVRSFSKFDFSHTEHLALVHSIGGEHKEKWNCTGYPGLGRAVRQIGAATSGEVEIDFVSSSIGAINADMVNMISQACKGSDGLAEYRERVEKSSSKKDSRSVENCQDALRLYFPTSDTVRQSRGGPNQAGTVCFQRRWYESPKFPKRILRDCRSVRKGLLMHNKMIFVKSRPVSQAHSFLGLEEDLRSRSPAKPPSEGPQGQCVPSWVYVGSANFSESAWGRLVQDRTSKKPKLSCRNWECGVVVRHAVDEMLVPMELGAPLISESGLSPWFFSAE